MIPLSFTGYWLDEFYVSNYVSWVKSSDSSCLLRDGLKVFEYKAFPLILAFFIVLARSIISTFVNYKWHNILFIIKQLNRKIYLVLKKVLFWKKFRKILFWPKMTKNRFVFLKKSRKHVYLYFLIKLGCFQLFFGYFRNIFKSTEAFKYGWSWWSRP